MLNTKYKAIFEKNKLLRFLNVILKGYGQVLICPNPITGLALCLVILYVSPTIWLFTLAGAVLASATAFLVRARPLHINTGVYGFNGVVLGVAWLWFFKLGAISVSLFVLLAVLSAVLMKVLMTISSRTKSNLPFFSVPSVILIWFVFVLFWYVFPCKWIAGPDQQIVDYVQGYKNFLLSYSPQFSMYAFLEIFYKHIVTFIVLFLGIIVHSRIAAKMALISFLITIIMIFILDPTDGLQSFDFYMYNTIFCALALGGAFLVFNRQVFLFALLGVLVTASLTFLGMKYLALPTFIAPFNITTILFLWIVKKGILKRENGFYAVPMEIIYSPESALRWYKGELYADNYWHKIEKVWYEK